MDWLFYGTCPGSLESAHSWWGAPADCSRYSWLSLSALTRVLQQIQFSPRYLSSAPTKLLLPTAALLVLAYLAYASYCLATAQTWRLLAPTVTLALGAAVSVGVIVWYAHLFVTMIPVDKDGYLINGPAQSWTAGLGQITAGLTVVWAGLLTYLQWSPDETRRPTPPGAPPFVD